MFYVYVHTYVGKMKSKGGVKKEGGQDDPSNVDAEQNFALYNLSITGKQYGDHPSLSNGE